MSFSGALGRGTYQSVIAGTARRATPTYYNSAADLSRLPELQREVQMAFAVRDSVFTPQFPEASPVAGVYRMPSKERRDSHLNRVMPLIRKRTILLERLREQRLRNTEAMGGSRVDVSATPDSAAYFAPRRHKATNNWPNFWQHDTMKHVVPDVRWRRRADLGGITRVEDAVPVYSKDY
jgi:hypothetical protein